MTILLVFVLFLPMSWFATRLVLNFLRHNDIFDHPNERSSHVISTPRGGGLATTPIILAGWGGWAIIGNGLHGILWLLVGGLLLLLISWRDDRETLSAMYRLFWHFVAALCGLLVIGKNQMIFQGVFSFWLDRLIGLFLFVWFINLFNFMDGIDGISGVEAIFIGGGICLIPNAPGKIEGMIVLASAAGFLFWNWQPARLFLGDSGSVPLGFFLGFLLLNLAANGFWTQSLILPAYYFADSGCTLVKRILCQEKIWKSHRSHFYQRAVQGGSSHASIVKLIAGGNTILCILALTALQTPYLSLIAAIVTTSAMLAIMFARGRNFFPTFEK